MAVPFIDLQRFEPGFLERWAEVSGSVTAETRFVGGPDVARLEERLAELIGVPAVVGCANGTDALQLALRAVGVSSGDRVLIPDATFWATFEAVVNVGGRPVTVDIDPVDAQMDFDLFARAVDEQRPSAAVLVHLYGWGSSRIDDFRSFCRERDLPLIEDGAQAYGVTWHGAPLFREAQLATVSFYPAKVLGACGDAGALVCGSQELADAVRLLGNHGRTSHYEHGVVGWNSRMAGLDAAYLDMALDRFEGRVASRRAAAVRYRAALADLGVSTLGPPDGYVENGYLSVALLSPDRRMAVEGELNAAGVGFGNVYPGAISEQPGAAKHLAAHVGGDRAARLGRGVLNLPLFAYITDEEVAEVLHAMERALEVTDHLGARGPFDWGGAVRSVAVGSTPYVASGGESAVPPGDGPGPVAGDASGTGEARVAP
ncbi:MAG: DegT/DnrJ/EryC1/StrS family aminotransferase [Anaerolineae bacterium]